MIALRHMLHCSHLVQNGRGGERPAVAASIVEVMAVAATARRRIAAAVILAAAVAARICRLPRR